MKTDIIGREREIEILEELYDSGKAELIAVYGRRRVGKTFLVKSMFMDQLDYFVTGKYHGSRKDELAVFHDQLVQYSGLSYPNPENWKQAFDQLRHYIESLQKKRIVIFIDEMPWLDTPKSGFVSEFDSFWNGWASTRAELMIIICGSATTWMNSNVLKQKGGLHNRCTRKIKLSQFSLQETELFLKSRNVKWSRHQIAECYMIMGGTPYYLDMLRKNWSVPQNIDYLFFRQDAELKDEYSILMDSLFKNSQIYRRVIELLARHSKGMTRQELMSQLKQNDGGAFTCVLEELLNCDFIRSYRAFGKTERDVMYQLTDMYVLFYQKFLKNNGGADENFWSNSVDSPTHRSWSGYAFEILCLNHIPQIKESLGIRGILSNVCSWYQPKNIEKGLPGGQIDLLIERRDQVINVCEAKYSMGPYAITGKYLDEMLSRMENFRTATKTRSALHLTMIVASGLVQNQYAGSIQSVITLDSLFGRP